MDCIPRARPLDLRTVWISDVHLGSRGCKADFLLDFLRSVECRRLYLVGDIVDLEKMQRALYWPPIHDEVLRAIIAKSANGTKIVYVPGNHDALLRAYAGAAMDKLVLRTECIHTTADGRRLLVLHGDEIERRLRRGGLLTAFAICAHAGVVALNGWGNRIRRSVGFPYSSIADAIKRRVRKAADYIASFEQAVCREASARGFDGVVCGHIHHADLKVIAGTLYCNDGDWVENCTALVETHAGALQLVHWADEKHVVKQLPALQAQSAKKIA